MSYKNRELCIDLNNAAQPGDFSRYTGDLTEDRQIRKEKAATDGMTDQKSFMEAVIAQQLG